METIKQTTKTYFKLLRTIHISIAMGPVLVFVTLMLSNQGETTVSVEKDPTMYYATIVVALASLMGFYVLSGLFSKQARQIKGLKGKMAKYRTLVIVRNAMLELPSIMAIVSYVTGSDEILLVIPVIILLIQLATYPSKNNVVRTFKLDRDEQLELSDPDAIISEYKRTYSNH